MTDHNVDINKMAPGTLRDQLDAISPEPHPMRDAFLEAALYQAWRAGKLIPADEVAVKPLEWVDFADRGAKAQAWNDANYMIQKWSDGRWEISASYPGYSTSIYGMDRFHPTLEAAKAAAQADYDARIMAAPDVQSITVQDAARVPEVQALIEAGEKVLHAIGELVANSVGVAGLHMNGEVADWESLLPGGSFGDWLYSVDGLRAALRAIEEGRE